MGQSQSNSEGDTYHETYQHYHGTPRHSNYPRYRRHQISFDSNSQDRTRFETNHHYNQNYSNLRRVQQQLAQNQRYHRPQQQQQQQSSQPNYMYYYDRSSNTVRRTTSNSNFNSSRDYSRVSRFGRAARSRQQSNQIYRNSEQIRQIIHRQQQRQILRQVQHDQPVAHLGRRRRRRSNSPVQNLDNFITNNNDDSHQNTQDDHDEYGEKIESLLFALPSADFVEREKQGSCSICLIELTEKIEAGDRAVVIPCYHVFHKNCIRQWMQAQGKAADCPLCGTLIDQDEGRLLLELAEQG